MSTGPFNLPGQSFGASPPYTIDNPVITADQGNLTIDGVLTGPFIRVKALQRGFYNGMWRDVGDVFDIYFGGEYSNQSVNITGARNADPVLPGWMQMVAPGTPLYTYALANGGQSTQVVASQGVNQGGQRVYGNARRYVA